MSDKEREPQPDLSDSQKKLMNESVEKAKWLAMQMQGQLQLLPQLTGTSFNHFEVITALSMIFAALLTSVDGAISLYEAQGRGLLDDDQRIENFGKQVKEFAAEIRKRRAEEEVKDQAKEMDNQATIKGGRRGGKVWQN